MGDFKMENLLNEIREYRKSGLKSPVEEERLISELSTLIIQKAKDTTIAEARHFILDLREERVISLNFMRAVSLKLEAYITNKKATESPL